MFRWSCEDFDRLVESGIFEDRSVELIDGDLIEMPAQSETHFQAVMRAVETLSRIFADRFVVRPQGPFHVRDRARVGPDIAVVNKKALRSDRAPDQAELIVEISHSTLHLDRERKTNLYASVPVPEYWIVNLNRNHLEVYREPMQDDTSDTGSTYGRRLTLHAGDTIAPLAMPDKPIGVSDLLP